jgi:hypothetical protein
MSVRTASVDRPVCSTASISIGRHGVSAQGRQRSKTHDGGDLDDFGHSEFLLDCSAHPVWAGQIPALKILGCKNYFPPQKTKKFLRPGGGIS